MARIVAEAEEALALFGARGWLDDPAAYHRAPPAPEGARTRRRRSGNVRYTALSWPDGFECRPGEPGAARYDDYAHNRIARAALLEHGSEDRPWLVCVHGFGMGSTPLDLRVFRALHLHRDLGLNLAFVTLPFHGRRGGPRFGVPEVPGADLLDDLHALAQSVWDVRQVLAHVRARTSRPVGLMGLSLGGCVAAVTASLEDVHAALLLVPVADLAGLMIEASEREGDTTSTAALLSGARPLLDPVSPLALTPRVPDEHRFLVAGTLDRFVPPSRQTVPLWRHWGEPPVHWYHGGHVSLFWARGVQRAIDDTLRRVGMA